MTDRSFVPPQDDLPAFALAGEDASELGTFRKLSGFFTGTESAYEEFERWGEERGGRITFEIDDLRPPPTGARLLTGSDLNSHVGNLLLNIEGRTGETIGTYHVAACEVLSRSAQADGTCRLLLAGEVGSLPHHRALSVWMAWRSGPPVELRHWVAIPPGQREGWVEVASLYQGGGRQDRGDGQHHRDVIRLPGKDIEDLASFFCALGEAVNGPGGYFGSNPMALEDCLLGGYGLTPPCSILWEDSSVARRHLARRVMTGAGEATYFEILRDTLERHQVRLVLE
ncbi:hypothetical protein FH609_018500 [Streptomyces sp. 3MP-14]|uniref:Barstar (barnase inhibitor) domain-containing protein n=2 Tax=Streptomyces TaxID=1883 RepID=A0A5N6AB50_9ACTN|nr:hypothetical protein FH607_015825 [Streptomyces mimosae]KAB8175644.1 hypothetical protein FH609_018500 [Streptomyces sp. 3MP-14]